MAGDWPARERARHRVHRLRPGDIKGTAGHRDAKAENPAAPTAAFGEREYSDILRAVEQAGRLRRIVDDLQSRRLRRRFEGKAGLNRDLVRGWESGEQLPELELVKDPPGPLIVVARPARLLEVELDRHVADDGHHPLAQPDLVDVRLECGFQPALGQLVDTLEQGFDADVVLDQLGGRLVADARHARDVVRGVAAQRFEIDELRRLEAVTLPHLVGAVDEGVGDASARHKSLHRLGDELQAVEVAGDDRDRVASLFADAGKRADDVVGFEAFDAMDGDRERLEHLAHHVHLRPQVVGHGAPSGFVLLIFLGAKCGFAKIEGGDGVLGSRRQHDRQHRGEAVDGIGHPAVRGAHRRQGKKCPIDQAVGVDQDEAPASSLRHVRILRRRRTSP